MSGRTAFDELMERVAAGDRLTADDLAGVTANPDILPLGMLADTVRRRLHGARVTYLRVALCPFDSPLHTVPTSAREIRLTGSPATLDDAVAAVGSARRLAAGRDVAGFSWTDAERLASDTHSDVADVLQHLRSAGLDALACVPLDLIESLPTALEQLMKTGFDRLRVTIDRATADSRIVLIRRVAALQEELGCIQALGPLPSTLNAFRPTTGYDDVRSVALARLVASNIPCIQVDWLRYGPKLAQVALTFGADDIDNVTASDEAPDGRRRAPLEDVRRNITAAGFEPVERDGRFAVIA